MIMKPTYYAIPFLLLKVFSDFFAKTKILQTSIFIFFWLPYLIHGQKLIAEIKVPERTKNISNLSGKLNDSVSFHLITNLHKRSNTYNVIPYFVNFENKLDSIGNFLYQQKPQFLTFFSDANTLSLVGQIKDKTLLTFLDYRQKTVFQKYLDLRADKVFSHQDFCLVFERPVSFKEINFAMIKSKDSIVDFSLSLKNKKQKSFFKDLLSGTGFVSKQEKADFINDKIYVEKGSVKPIKGFWNKSQLVFFDNDKTFRDLINIFEINLDGTLSERTLDVSKTNTSFISHKSLYLKDEMIFVFKILNKIAVFEIYDYTTLEKIKSIVYDGNDIKKYNEVIIKGKKISSKELNFKKFLRGFRAKELSFYNPGAYIGVNKDSTNKNYLVEMGHVHKSEYVNPNSLNPWWQYDEFVTKYPKAMGGPGIAGGVVVSLGIGMIAMANTEEKMKGNYLKVHLDENINFTKKELVPEFRFFDRVKYEKKYNELGQLKNYFLFQ